MRNIILFLIIAWSSQSLALSAGAQEDTSSLVFERQHIDFQIYPDGRYLKSVEQVVRIPSQNAISQLQTFGTIPYEANSQNVRIISARTEKPDGKTLSADQLRVFDRSTPIASGSGRVDDTHYKVITFPNVTVGDTIVFNYSIEQLSSPYLGHFGLLWTFMQNRIVIDETLKVSVPAELAKHLVIESYDVQAPVETETGGRREYVWTHTNDKNAPDELGSVSRLDFGPRVYMSSYSSYADIAKLYNNAMNQMSTDDPDIVALANDLTRGETDSARQATILYYWVANNIRYLNIAIDLHKWVPNKPSDVLRNKYGDCKDHAILLASLLIAKNIPAQFALVRTDTSFFVPMAPLPIFNHVITYLPSLNIFADSTARYTPFGMLPWSDAGKRVLIVDTGELMETPFYDSSNVGTSLQSIIHINEDGSATGESIVDTYGANSVQMRTEIAATSKGGDADFIKKYLPDGTGLLFHDDLDVIRDHFIYGVRYSIRNRIAAEKSGELSFDIGLKGPRSILSLTDTIPTRERDFLCRPGTFIEKITVVFPRGIKTVKVPPDVEIDSKETSLRIHYIFDGTAVTAARTYKRTPSAPVCAAGTYQELKSVLDRMNVAIREHAYYAY